MNESIFRAYDIRGVYPTEINEETCGVIGRAYASVFRPKTVCVGMDCRDSSESLKRSLVEGLLLAGVGVTDLGKITTDMLYFAVGHYGYSGGIVVSASHNPREYNGLKLVKENAAAISSDTGLIELKNSAMARKCKLSNTVRGKYDTRDIYDDYMNFILSFINLEELREFRIVANANFGFVSNIMRRLIQIIPLEIVPINFEPNGLFPKGPPDPLLEANRVETVETIQNSRVDFGVAWDADGDRILFFDEDANYISGAYTTALLATIMLAKYGHKNKIILDPRIVWPIIGVVKEIGGEPIITKCGHTFIKDRMRLEDALFAGEMSGHYYFRENFYADNGLIPLLLVLEFMSKNRRKYSEIMRPIMMNHFMSGELNYRVNSTEQAIAGVRNNFRERGKEEFIDGYSVESKNWRFNLRPSNTEALLRLNIEAREKTYVDDIRGEIEGIVKGN